MENEIEVKFLDVDFDDIRKKLKSINASQTQPMRVLRRSILDYPGNKLQKNNSYVRVRDEGDKITLTYKQFVGEGIDAAREAETEVDSYSNTITLLENIGLKVVTEQETKRETWKINDVEVVLDMWPWLDPYIEIEGNSEDSIKQIAEKLGFNWKDVFFGDVMVAYRHQYPDIVKTGWHLSLIPKINFDTPKPKELS
ncbi:MAG TPA: class IV adenylate cyclase [Candidatus Saccharibacteria bacterium]|nr:class IV adenylate cyclase [Candidatus Saccharibacteria bacterium]